MLLKSGRRRTAGCHLRAGVGNLWLVDFIWPAELWLGWPGCYEQWGALVGEGRGEFCLCWVVGRSGCGDWILVLACLRPEMDHLGPSLKNVADLCLRHCLMQKCISFCKRQPTCSYAMIILLGLFVVVPKSKVESLKYNLLTKLWWTRPYGQNY